MVRRGFSTVMSNLIFFIGVIVAVSLAVVAMTFMVKQLQNAMEKRTEVTVNRTNTILQYVDGGYNGSYMWFYVKNIGNTDLDVNKFDIFVEGFLVGGCNGGTVTCTDEGSNFILSPDEIMEVNFLYSATTGAYRVRAVAENGVYAEGEVVVG